MYFELSIFVSKGIWISSIHIQTVDADHLINLRGAIVWEMESTTPHLSNRPRVDRMPSPPKRTDTDGHKPRYSIFLLSGEFRIVVHDNVSKSNMPYTTGTTRDVSPEALLNPVTHFPDKRQNLPVVGYLSYAQSAH